MAGWLPLRRNDKPPFFPFFNLLLDPSVEGQTSTTPGKAVYNF